MIDYQSFQYLFPPRPKNAIPHQDLKIWDNGTMLAQPKINGSNCTIYTNGENVFVYNRHGQRMSGFDIDKSDILELYKGKGWWVFNGEFTNKGKKNESGESFQNKFCLFDILVSDSKYLLGTTFSHRVDLMKSLYGSSDNYLTKLNKSIYLVNSFNNNFSDIYQSLINIDMIEGLVLKRKNGKLEIGASENNNTKSQIKARKPTKNYKF
jgi:hypothetical protein